MKKYIYDHDCLYICNNIKSSVCILKNIIVDKSKFALEYLGQDICVAFKSLLAVLYSRGETQMTLH